MKRSARAQKQANSKREANPSATGLRIGEAVAVRWSDFEGNLLNVSHRIYDGEVDAVKTKGAMRKLPIEPALMSRMRQLGSKNWVFTSRGGTPLNPGQYSQAAYQTRCHQAGHLARRNARLQAHSSDNDATQGSASESDLGHLRSCENFAGNGHL
jgi:integrase